MVRRGRVVESGHVIHTAVVDGNGHLIASVGDPERAVVYRSAAKPFQAVPLADDGVLERFGLTTEELALCCASHNSEPRHIESARSILEKAGLTESDLECGPHVPFFEHAATQLLLEGEEPSPIHNNCSGSTQECCAWPQPTGGLSRGTSSRTTPCSAESSPRSRGGRSSRSTR